MLVLPIDWHCSLIKRTADKNEVEGSYLNNINFLPISYLYLMTITFFRGCFSHQRLANIH
jgi:hypothetical protein